MRQLYFLSLCLFSCLWALSLQAQTNNSSSLSIPQIMAGEDFVGYLPSNARWSEDGQSIYFSWNPEKDSLRSTYAYSLKSKQIQKLNTEAQKALIPSSGDYSRDRRYKVFEKYGDLFHLDRNTNKVRALTNTNEYESNPQFDQSEKGFYFQKGNNLFHWNLESGLIQQLSNFRAGNESKDAPLAPHKEWLENDQAAYFQILEQRKALSELRRARNEELQKKSLKPVYLGKKRIRSLSIRPQGDFVVYHLFQAAPRENTIVPNYVSQSGYTEDLNARSKVGAPQNQYETWVYDLKKDSTYQISSQDIPGIKRKPDFMKEYVKEGDEYSEDFEKERKLIFSGPIYSPSGRALLVARSMDNKDRWIMELKLSDASLEVIDHQRDEAWIGGPGIQSWNFTTGNIGWIDDQNVWFQSEESGYSHLYRYDLAKGQKKALSSGNFEILSAQLSQDKSTFYLSTNRESPHQHHFYHLSVQGGEMKKISSGIGAYEVEISPDEKNLLVRHSQSNQPWELYLMPNKAGAKMTQITQSQSDAFKKYSWRKPKIISFSAQDGRKVPARLYQPSEDKKSGAAVVFVHGAGYLQNVHEWWSSYYREYMFHNLLVDNGYTVLDIDYRGSAGYGRDWRTAIYRHMGGKDLSDQVDGAKYLVDELGIDSERVGIYGGSYGGFITLMAMFNAPGTFKAGAALRSVTDWAHYNHGYTSNILNTPVEDSLAYARSSPLYFAEGLEDHLLILHGMIDRNVHFQDVVRLSQRLIELEKDHWEFSVFPLEGHGFVESSSWTDEYKRIFKLFQTHLKE